MEAEQQRFGTQYGSENNSSPEVTGTSSPCQETSSGHDEGGPITPQQETNDQTIQHGTTYGSRIRVINEVPDEDNNDATVTNERRPLLGKLKKRNWSRVVVIICMLIAIVLAVVPPLTLGLVHRSTQPQNTSFFAVDSYAVYTVWLANVTTGWYKSLDIRIFSNSTSDQKITVYTIPLSNYLAITPSNISIQCDQTLGQPMSIIPPWYNISLQKAYLNARTHFLYRVCISQPSQIIDVGVHIFLISNDTDQTGYLNYILTGDTASALLSNNTTIGLSQTGCVSVNMTVPKNAFYYTATSVTSPQPPNTLVIFTMNCTSAMQITRVNEYNGDTCTANSNEPCSISLPGSEAVVNTNHQKIAILAKAPTNMSNVKLQTIAIADMASTGIAIAVGIVFIGLVLFAIIGTTITKKYIYVHVLSR